MGLLRPAERNQLITILLRMPGGHDPNRRAQLLWDLPADVRERVAYDAALRPHIMNIVEAADPEAETEPPAGGWPVLALIDQALKLIGSGWASSRQLRDLRDILAARAEQWGSIGAAFAPGAEQDAPELERLIDSLAGFQDPEQWIDGMRRSIDAVCRVEVMVGTGLLKGTGFLLGPDLVMTNYHVLAPVIAGAVEPAAVRLRFDYKMGVDGLSTCAGQEYRLRADWLMDKSPVAQLDYALVRLDRSAGQEPSIGQTDVRPRGWLNPWPHEFVPGEPLFILQHPGGEPMKVAFDRIAAIPSRTRVLYRTNTRRGSSGAPCFTVNWQLVALHHGFDPKSQGQPNEGIPFAAILEQPKVRAAIPPAEG